MATPLPLAGIRVLEFTHVVMGPVVGLVLADLGAEVIHVEPPGGEATRRLRGFGAGFFSFYNRNKKSVAVDLKDPADRAAVLRLVEEVDVVVENFGPGTFDRLGFSYAALSALNPRLVYCSLKGFLDGPYAERIGVDEVVQMMGGLAYMTGREGDPMRAGTSALDITGGLFGVIAILTALYERTRTGRGKLVRASLYETSAFLMGQFMACITPAEPEIKPMPSRKNVWPIYQLFETSDGPPVFLGVISDRHWQRLCTAYGWDDLAADERYATSAGRADHKAELLPQVVERLAARTHADVVRQALAYNLPHAVVKSPAQLLEDEHLLEGGHLLDTQLVDGTPTRLPRLPIDYGDERFRRAERAPDVGADNAEVLGGVA